VRPSIKYPVTLLILLLTGYTQVFAHLWSPDAPYPSAKEVKRLHHFQVPVATTEKAEVYFEEEEEKEEKEEKRSCLKEYSKTQIYMGIFNAHLPGYFLHRLATSSINKYSDFSFFGSSGPVFHVLRL
jgi:hypothetical protein